MADELYDKAMEAITKLFSDTTIPESETVENLKSLQNEIDVMIDSLDSEEGT